MQRGEDDTALSAEADSRSTKLEDAYQAAENGNPRTLTVRAFIGWWGAKGRGHRVVERISADLDNHSLETHPDFRKVSLDATITIVAQPTAIDDEEPHHVESPADTNDLEVGLTLGNVPSALAGITSVNPDDSLETAMTVMRLNDFSQLAVMTSPYALRGSVTWRSIAKALAHESAAILADAIEPARERSFDQDLIDLLSMLYDHEFVFVKNAENKISGIVTAADVVKLYGETATPFFILGEIDHLLRGFVSDEWTIEQVIDVCDPEDKRDIESHDDLSFGDYQRMLENPDRFVVLEWPLDRKTFVKALDEVREIRNRVAHFDPDPLEPEAVALLRNFLHLLRDLRGWALR
jgi:CBS domain-containing protein